MSQGFPGFGNVQATEKQLAIQGLGEAGDLRKGDDMAAFIKDSDLPFAIFAEVVGSIGRLIIKQVVVAIAAACGNGIAQLLDLAGKLFAGSFQWQVNHLKETAIKQSAA